MKTKGIQDIIDYMEATDEKSWAVGVVRREWPGAQTNCFFGHLFNMESDEHAANELWGIFEEGYATTFMIYPVNDGEHPKYQQSTPKQRVIAYLKDLRDGKEMTTHEHMENDYKHSLSEKHKP